MTTPDVPIPAGAAADDWPSVAHDGTLVRALTWATHDTGKCSVEICGSQFADTGLFDRAIAVFGADDTELSAEEARQLAAALLDAADALERLEPNSTR